MRGKCDYSRCLLGGIHIKKQKKDRVFSLTDLILGLIWFCIWTQHPASASTKLGLFSVLSLFSVEGRHLVCIISPFAELQLQQEDCVISSPQASWSCLVPERNTSPSPWSPQHVTVLSVMVAPVAPHTMSWRPCYRFTRLSAAPLHPHTVHDAYVILFWIITPTFLSYLASQMNVFWCNVMLTFARYT